MSLRDQLMENYEESLMALFMNEIADYEGELLQKENERLENDPSFEVPLQLDHRCLNTISRSRFRLRRKCAARPRGKRHMAVRVILIAALASFSLLAGACCAFPAFGASVHNLLIRATDAATYFSFEDRDADRAAAAKPEFDYSIPELPSGFKVAYSETSPIYRRVKFSNTSGSSISITVFEGDSSNLNVNTEDYVAIESIDENNFEGVISRQPDDCIVAAIANIQDLKFVTIRFDGIQFSDAVTFVNEFVKIN